MTASLHEMLGLAREMKGWTLRRLEKATGISNSLLSQMETGKVRDPSFRNIVVVARVLGISLERLATAAAGDAPFPPAVMARILRRSKPNV